MLARLSLVRITPSGALFWACIMLPWLLPWAGSPADVRLYHQYADAWLHGAVPYVTIPIEYPPLAFVAFAVPRWLAADASRYVVLFIILMGAVDTWQKVWLWRRLPAYRTIFLFTYTVASAALSYTYFKRFDLVAAALTTWALGRILHRADDTVAWLLLGAAIAIKLYPVVIVPVVMGYAWQRQVGWRPMLLRVLCLATAALLPSIVAYSLWGGPSLNWLVYQRDRGLHVASSYAAVAIALQGFGQPLPVRMAFGSHQITASWVERWVVSAPFISGSVSLLTWALCWRRLRTPESLWQGASATVVALLVTSKVLSPQYMVWLVPLVTMACVGRQHFDVKLAGVLWLACLLTASTYPNEYKIGAGDASKQIVLLARNGVLVVMWVYLLRRIFVFNDEGASVNAHRMEGIDMGSALKRFLRGAFGKAAVKGRPNVTYGSYFVSVSPDEASAAAAETSKKIQDLWNRVVSKSK